MAQYESGEMEYEPSEEDRKRVRSTIEDIDAEIGKFVAGRGGGSEGEINEGSRDALTDLITRHLNSSESTTRTLVIQHVCSALLSADIPVSTLAAAVSSLASHNEVQVLQEALLDVIEVSEEADADAKDEVDGSAKSKREGLGEGDLKKLEEDIAAFAASAKGRAERRQGLIRSLLESNFLSSDLVAHLLDAHELPSLGVISALNKFTPNERRRRTTQFYKQKKYTLLRECSEGWTRLIVLLGDESLLGAGGDDEDGVDRARRARSLWKRSLAVIGFFDLSPPRVLDVILDAFNFWLSTHWRFFVDLLNVSPWGKKDSGNVGGKGKQRADVDAMDLGQDTSDQELTEFRQAVSEEAGNATLAQVLGFKFVQHQAIDGDLKGLHRDVDATPRELLLVTAILLREGLVRTLDILPHLSPDDKGMNTLVSRYARKVKEQIQSLGGNALMNSGPLADDSAPTATETAAPSGAAAGESAGQTIRKDLVEQRALLCEALLAIGHLPPAFYLLSRWPIIAQSHPVISDLLLRIVDHQIAPAYALITSSRPAQADRTPYRSHFAFSEPKEVLTTLLPVPLDTEKRRFRFFFTDWTRGLQPWHSVEEVAKAVWPFVRFVGAMGARDVDVLVKLCRIGVRHMSSQRDTLVEAAWLNVIRTCLLPALPLLPASFSFNNEVWPLLKRFKYTFRYSLYGEWHVAMTDSFEKRTWNPTMALAAARTMNDAKQVLKRMTSGLERAHARAIGKASYSAPTAMWSVILPQISSYQNMIPTVVEGARYLSDFGWDVTIYMLLDALSDTARDRVKEDGLSASVWLQGVASFIGTLARRYPQMDLEPVLQQVANRLKTRSLADLITLRELIIKMANISPLQNVSPTQVACFSGGRLLYEEGIQVTRSENPEPPKSEADKASMLRSNKRPIKRPQYEKSTKRLVNILLNTGLALPILIGIAQARQISAFVAKARLRHTKQMSLAFDESQGILMQYSQLLQAGLTSEQYAQFVPSLRQSQCDFALDLAVCYFMLRPKLSWQITNREEFLRVRLRKYRKELTDRERDFATWDDSPWQAPLWLTMVDSAVASSGKYAGKGLEPFFATFWQLSLPELAVPEAAYKSSINWLQTLASDLNVWRVDAHDQAWADSYKANRSEVLVRAQALERERTEQKKAVDISHERLRQEARNWFLSFSPITVDGSDRQQRRQALNELHGILHQQCFFPRSVFSMADATFVATFAKLLHQLNTENFAIFVFWDKFFDDSLGACMFACTETEAGNLARCLQLMVEDMERWRGSKEIYKSEGTGEQADGPSTFQGLRVDTNQLLTWGQYQSLCKKWHRKISKAVVGCLSSSDYLHVKNGIIIGRGLMPCFPKMRSSQQELINACKTFLEAESIRSDARDDLVILVKSYEDALAFAGRDNSASAIKLIADELFSPPAPLKQKRPEVPIKVDEVGTQSEPRMAPESAPVEPKSERVALPDTFIKAEQQTAAPNLSNAGDSIPDKEGNISTVSLGTPPVVLKSVESAPQDSPSLPAEPSVDLNVLRERLMQNKTAAKAPATPPRELSAAKSQDSAAGTVTESTLKLPESTAIGLTPLDAILPQGTRADVPKVVVVKGSAASHAPEPSSIEVKAIVPTEPRSREPPKEPRSRQTSRAGDATLPTGPAADMSNIPKGPKASSIETRMSNRKSSAASRQPSPPDGEWSRREAMPIAGAGVAANVTTMQPPASRPGPVNPSLTDGSASRKATPDRARTQRDPSVESKLSRTSDRIRSQRDPSGAADLERGSREDRDRRPRDSQRDEKPHEPKNERTGRDARLDERLRDRNSHQNGSTTPAADARLAVETDKLDRNTRHRTDRDGREPRADDRKDREKRARDDRGERSRYERDERHKEPESRDDRRRAERDKDRDREKEKDRDKGADKERDRDKDRDRDRQRQRDREREEPDGRGQDRQRANGARDDRPRALDHDRNRNAREKDDHRDDRDRPPRGGKDREREPDRDAKGNDRSDRRDRDRTPKDIDRPPRTLTDDHVDRGTSGSSRPLPPHLAKQREVEPERVVPIEASKPSTSRSAPLRTMDGGAAHLELLSARFDDRRMQQQPGTAKVASEVVRPSDEAKHAGNRPDTNADKVRPSAEGTSADRKISSALGSGIGKLAQRISSPTRQDRPPQALDQPNTGSRELLSSGGSRFGNQPMGSASVQPSISATSQAASSLSSTSKGLGPARATNGIRSAADIEAATRLLSSDTSLGSRLSAAVPNKLGARITPAPESSRLADLRASPRPASSSPTLSAHGLPTRPASSSTPPSATPGGSNLAAALSQAPQRSASPAAGASSPLPMGRPLKRPNEDTAEGTAGTPASGGQKRPRIDRERARERPERQPRGGPNATAFSRLSGLIKPADGGGGR